MKGRAEALTLVEAAFMQAQRKQGIGTKSMALAVLNNRLLQMTERRFRPQDFGVTDLRAFVALLSPDFLLRVDGTHAAVERGETGSAATAAGRTAQRPFTASPATKTPPTAVVGSGLTVSSNMQLAEPGRIRKDLWLAIVDYSSGRTYVWDANSGLARIAQSQDRAPRIPTLTPVELDEWRLTFVEDNRPSLGGAALASVQRWQEQRLSTSYLPFDLRKPGTGN